MGTWILKLLLVMKYNNLVGGMDDWGHGKCTVFRHLQIQLASVFIKGVYVGNMNRALAQKLKLFSYNLFGKYYSSVNSLSSAIKYVKFIPRTKWLRKNMENVIT